MFVYGSIRDIRVVHALKRTNPALMAFVDSSSILECRIKVCLDHGGTTWHVHALSLIPRLSQVTSQITWLTTTVEKYFCPLPTNDCVMGVLTSSIRP